MQQQNYRINQFFHHQLQPKYDWYEVSANRDWMPVKQPCVCYSTTVTMLYSYFCSMATAEGDAAWIKHELRDNWKSFSWVMAKMSHQRGAGNDIWVQRARTLLSLLWPSTVEATYQLKCMLDKRLENVPPSLVGPRWVLSGPGHQVL